MNNKYKTIVGILVAAGVTGSVLLQPKANPDVQIPPEISKIEWIEPVTDEGWAEDVKEESLDIRTNTQLLQMKKSLVDSLIYDIDDYNRLTKYPDECLYRNIEVQKKTTEEADTICTDDLNRVTLEIQKIGQSQERIEKEIELRERGYLTVKTKQTATEADETNPQVRILQP